MNQNFVITKSQEDVKQPKIIKRYGNRKLYDTEQSSYVVLSDLQKMIRNNEEIRVIDNETKNDITISTFIQIIFGAEKKAKHSAPLDVLRNIIRNGDGSVSHFLAEIGIFKPSVNTAKSPSFKKKETRIQASPKKPASLEERIVNAATSSSHDIIEENDLPELPNANKNLNN